MGRLKIDPEARARGLARLRREQVVAESRLSVAERLERATALTSLAEALHPNTAATPPGRPRRRSRSS